MLPSFVAGIGLGFSLIVAIGAQNLFVLRQGLRREYALTVALVCAVSDAALIALGVSGIGLVLGAVPWLLDVVRWAGAAFLLCYGLLAARRAWRPAGVALQVETNDGADAALPTGGASTGGASAGGASAGGASAGGTTSGARTRVVPVVLTCLALTWLNPHVYLDTVFLLGSVATTHGDSRWVFAAGAMLASILWFFALGFGARYLSRWLSTPRAWRVLDAVIAVVMIALAVGLVLPR